MDAIVALSNMSSDQNAILAERVYGIYLITSDISSNGTPFNFTKEIQLPSVEKRGFGRPYHIANNYDYGIAIGKLDLQFSRDTATDQTLLTKITEQNFPVNDRIAPDTILIHEIKADLDFVERKQGDLMFPAFTDIIEQKPTLENYDETTKHGRMSKALWEKFIANLLRRNAPAEVALVRKVPSFLPLIGKLHEREVRSWLWVEDEIELMDLKGRDIRRLFESHKVDDLVTSGVASFKTPRRTYWFVNGRFMQEDVYYRVATTNVITQGPLEEHFRWGLKKTNKFELKENGLMKRAKDGKSVPLRDFMIREMKRIRSLGKGKSHHKRIAEILIPSTQRERLFTLNFVKPTLWSSFNRSFRGDGYETVPESRVIANNSFIIGADGGLILTMDKERFAWDFGTRLAFAEQRADVGVDEYQKTETMDDVNINLTLRYKGKKSNALAPFARLEYDSEFTPTFNTSTEQNNPRQQILRSTLGLSREYSRNWPVLELGLTGENDFSSKHYQYGVQGRSKGQFPLDKNWHILYLLTNNFNYFFPTANDTDRELSFKYNMIHELLIPLLGNISLSVGADFYFYKGKTEINNDPGMSMLMRVGVTYNRRWKPRFQSLF